MAKTEVRHNLTPEELSAEKIKKVKRIMLGALRKNVNADPKNSSYTDALLVLGPKEEDKIALAQANKGNTQNMVRIDVFNDGLPEATIKRLLKEGRVIWTEKL